MAIYRFSKWRPSAILELFTTIRDHPRSLCCWQQLPVKFHVNLILDLIIYSYLNFSHIWLEMPIQAPKMRVFGDFGPLKCDFHHRDPKGTYLRKSTSFKLSTVKVRWGVWPLGELTESVTDTHRPTPPNSGSPEASSANRHWRRTVDSCSSRGGYWQMRARVSWPHLT